LHTPYCKTYSFWSNCC